MKKRMICGVVLFCCLFLGFCTQRPVELKDRIVGKWCNPYTYQNSGELKGFEFKKNGECAAVNIPSLDLKTWEIKNDTLIVKGFQIEENGEKTLYETQERISLLTRDSLRLVFQEANPRLEFLYLNMETLQMQNKEE